MIRKRTYLAIDLKSFYASVECLERGLNPLTTHLLVADASRTDKTICLAVSPALKAVGVPGRPRLFEAIQKINDANARRLRQAHCKEFSGSSSNAAELAVHPDWSIDFITAPPRMALYIDYSTRIYDVYLRHIAPEDIHVYSIDEVFIDISGYLQTRKMTARQFTVSLLEDVYQETGVTATAGIGSNLYLCKVAMDIVAKHERPDLHGMRIAELDEDAYRRLLWNHTPITDFWRVGGGYARKLAQYGLFTMGDVARCSLGTPGMRHSEELLYKLFGINAELLIDHAWGWESCTMADIKAYRPSANSLSTGQVLHCPYTNEKARLIVKEMTELLVLDLVEKRLVTDQMVLVIGYENLNGQLHPQEYSGPVTVDYYGRQTPKHANGSINLPRLTSSGRLIAAAMLTLFDRITDPALLIRRINVVAARVYSEKRLEERPAAKQLDLFTDHESACRLQQLEDERLQREHRCQQAVVAIRRKFGKNAILRGMNLEEGATSIDRNRQIGGHHA